MMQRFFLSILSAFLIATPAFASSFGTNATTMFRQTTFDLYGSKATYSPVYQYVSYNFADAANFDGSVYLRARTGNVYYSSEPNDILLYSAFADWKPNDNFTLRSGRQTVYQNIRVFSIDGFKVEIPSLVFPNVGISGYLGKPANLYSGNPDRNLIGFRTNIDLKDNLSLAMDYSAEQKGGADLTRIGGIKCQTSIRDLSLDALLDYNLLRSVTKDYALNASLPLNEKLNLLARYTAQTPEFDPESVYAVFSYSFNQVQQTGLGADYNPDENTNIYSWLGSIAQDNGGRGFDWRLGFNTQSGMFDCGWGLDVYKTQGLDGDRSNSTCSVSKNFSDKLKCSGGIGYNTFTQQSVTTGDLNLDYKAGEHLNLGIDYQTVLGGFSPNAKLLATASINLGE